MSLFKELLQKEIDSFYAKYAKSTGITMAEAKKAVSKLDIEEYGRKAAKYVADKDFSAKANAEMKLYNATMKINRLELLKSNIGLEMVSSFDELDTYMGGILTDRARAEFKRQAGILGDVVKDIDKAADTIVRGSFKNATFSDRIWMYQDMLKGSLVGLLSQGLIQGRNPKVLAKDLRELFGVQKYQAERLMRTEMARVQIEAQKQSFVAGGYEQYIFIATLDSKTCETCGELDGKVFNVKDMETALNAPPMHPNCVLPDTVIFAPDADAIMKSEYSGNVIEFGTSNGRRLTVTPNHIVLTARGWVRAKNLVEGDKVVYYCGNASDGVHTEPANNNSSVTIENLFASIIEAGGGTTLRTPVSPVDFKGDVLPDSEVDVVFIDSELRNKLDSSSAEFISDSSLIGAFKTTEGELTFKSSLAKLLVGIGLAADGIMSGSDVASILFRRTLTHHELVGLRLSSDYDARLKQTAMDSRTTNAKTFRYSLFADSGDVHVNNFLSVERYSSPFESNSGFFKDSFDSTVGDSVGFCDFASAFSGVIAFDDVVFVANKFYSGHVYDSSCMSTLYIANGIITSNCRCSCSAASGRDITLNAGEFESADSSESEKIERNADSGTIKSSGHVYAKTGNMTSQEYVDYKRTLNSVKSYEQVILPKDEYAHIMSEINTNMSSEDRKQAVVTLPIGDYNYTFINKGFNDYTIIKKTQIDMDLEDYQNDIRNK